MIEDIGNKPFKPFWRWLREWRDPNRSLRMHILKKLVNFGIHIVSPLFPQRVPTRPATSLLTRIEHHLEMVEAFKRELKPRDENFLRLLEAMFRMVRYIAETDPYYQLWLGYFMKRVTVEYEGALGEYMRQLKQLGDEHPEFPQLKDLRFRLRAFNLKMCGGLQLVDEKLMKENK